MAKLGCCPSFVTNLGSSALKPVDPKPLLRVQLGVHHEAFIRWCGDMGHEPAAVIKQLVDMALANSIALPRKEKDLGGSTPKRLRINLGEKHEPFAAWCAQHGLAARAIVKNWVLGLLTKEISLATPSEKIKYQEVVGVRDETRERKEIRLSKSELVALEQLAELRKEDAPKFMSRILRAYLLKTPGFTPQEVSLLGVHNLLLLRVCNNLNQLAKHANTTAARGDVLSIDTIANLPAELDAIRAHVKHVSTLLSNNRERWLITADF
jgi:hypothetical protein